MRAAAARCRAGSSGSPCCRRAPRSGRRPRRRAQPPKGGLPGGAGLVARGARGAGGRAAARRARPGRPRRAASAPGRARARGRGRRHPGPRAPDHRARSRRGRGAPGRLARQGRRRWRCRASWWTATCGSAWSRARRRASARRGGPGRRGNAPARRPRAPIATAPTPSRWRRRWARSCARGAWPCPRRSPARAGSSPTGSPMCPAPRATWSAGVVVYSNEAKEELLGVPRDLLRAHGAVSAPVAEAMARGICRVGRHRLRHRHHRHRGARRRERRRSRWARCSSRWRPPPASRCAASASWAGGARSSGNRPRPRSTCSGARCRADAARRSSRSCCDEATRAAVAAEVERLRPAGPRGGLGARAESAPHAAFLGRAERGATRGGAGRPRGGRRRQRALRGGAPRPRRLPRPGAPRIFWVGLAEGGPGRARAPGAPRRARSWPGAFPPRAAALASAPDHRTGSRRAAGGAGRAGPPAPGGDARGKRRGGAAAHHGDVLDEKRPGALGSALHGARQPATRAHGRLIEEARGLLCSVVIMRTT